MLGVFLGVFDDEKHDKSNKKCPRSSDQVVPMTTPVFGVAHSVKITDFINSSLWLSEESNLTKVLCTNSLN